MRRAFAAAVVLTLAVAAPVAAVAPPNDELAGAIEVSVGTTVTQNTDDATTDAFETSLNEFCGAPAMGGAVWFEFTPTESAFIAFNVEESDFSAGVIVTGDPPTPEGVINCGPGNVAIDAVEGETYFIMAFGDGLSAATTGTLVFKVLEAVPPPDIELTIDRSATVNRQGVVRLTGTVTCTSDDGSGEVVEIFGDLRQRVGRILISGFFGTFVGTPCDGSTNPWEVFVVGDNGIFAGGKAATVAIGVGCTDFCSEAFVEATVQLKRSGR